jgi:hypothetical protein
VFVLCADVTPVGAVALLGAAAAFLGFVSPQLLSIAQTLGGSRAAGQWMGLQNTVGNFAGIVAPLVTGIVVDRTGTYSLAFVVVGVVSLLGTLAWGLLIPKVAPERWPDE